MPAEPPRRLTITLPVINHAAAVFFFVAGKGKAGSLHRALVGPCDPVTCPAVGVRPEAGDVVSALQHLPGLEVRSLTLRRVDGSTVIQVDIKGSELQARLAGLVGRDDVVDVDIGA